MSKELYIIGAGGFGREVAWLAERVNEVEHIWDMKGFIDDDETLLGTLQGSYPVVGGCDFILNIKREIWVVCAIGCAAVRKKIVGRLENNPKIRFATLVDPAVLRSGRVSIGEGSILCAGTILTVDISVGKHVIVNLDCTIGHDVKIQDFVTVYPSVNVSGQVVIGEGVEIGTGAQVIQGKRICAGSVIGAGAVVVKDIVEKGTYVGVPAKR